MSCLCLQYSMCYHNVYLRYVWSVHTVFDELSYCLFQICFVCAYRIWLVTILFISDMSGLFIQYLMSYLTVYFRHVLFVHTVFDELSYCLFQICFVCAYRIWWVTILFISDMFCLCLSYLMSHHTVYFRYVWSGLIVVLGIYINIYSKNRDRWNAAIISYYHRYVRGRSTIAQTNFENVVWFFHGNRDSIFYIINCNVTVKIKLWSRILIVYLWRCDRRYFSRIR